MKQVEAADIKNVLKTVFGFDTFKGEQREIIESLLDGRDTFVIMPTGGQNLCVISHRYCLRHAHCNFSADCINEKSG